LVDYVTQEEMETYVAAQGFTTVPNTVSSIVNTVDNWYELLLDILNRINNEVNEVNGENVVGTIVDRFEYLIETKRLIKEKIQQYVDMPDYTPFREYVKWIGMIHGNPVKLSVITSVKRVPKATITIPDTINRLPLKTVTCVKGRVIPYSIVNAVSVVPTVNLTYERVDN
jgi:hypothetical protein